MRVRNASLMPSFRRMASLIVCSFASATAFFCAFFAAELASSRPKGFEVSVISVCLGKQRSYRHYGTTFVRHQESQSKAESVTWHTLRRVCKAVKRAYRGSL